MSGRPTQFASKTGVGTTGLFLCSNALGPYLIEHLLTVAAAKQAGAPVMD